MRLDWRQGILYATTIGIEGCWLYALLALLNRQAADGRLAVSGILLLYLISVGLNGLLRRLRWPRFCLRTISWLAWAIAMLLVIKVQLFGGLAWADTTWLLAVPRALAAVIYAFQAELLVLLCTIVVWWLGQRLAYLRVGFTTLISEFQFGLFVMAVTFFAATQLEIKLAHSIYLVAAFFIFSLLGVSVAHALEGTSWLSGLYQGHWLGLLLVSIGLVLILGFVISLVVTPDLLQLVLSALKWLWGLILKVIAFLASLLPEPGPAEQMPAMPAMPEAGPDEDFKLVLKMPESVRSGLTLAWMIMAAGLCLVALWRVSSDILRWLRRRLASMAGAEFEPQPGAFRADLLDMLKRILFKLLGLKRLLSPRASAEPLIPEIASVRHIYLQFLRWAAAAGFPRRKSQTPHEYFDELAAVLPEARGDLSLMTQQYIRTRYGAWLPTEEDLHQLKQSWYNMKQNRLADRRQA